MTTHDESFLPERAFTVSWADYSRGYGEHTFIVPAASGDEQIEPAKRIARELVTKVCEISGATEAWYTIEDKEGYEWPGIEIRLVHAK